MTMHRRGATAFVLLACSLALPGCGKADPKVVNTAISAGIFVPEERHIFDEICGAPVAGVQGHNLVVTDIDAERLPLVGDAVAHGTAMIAIKDAQKPRKSALDAGGEPMSCAAKKVSFTYTANGAMYKAGRKWSSSWTYASFDFALAK